VIRQVLALGTTGARMAEALVYQCMAGLPAWEQVSITLMGAPEADGARLRELVGHYAAVQRSVGSGNGPYSVKVSLCVWPEETATASLAEQAADETDRLLCRALFTPEQASLSPAHAMDRSGAVASVTWASCLDNTDDPALRAILDNTDPEGKTPCVLLAGLCEPSGAAGVISLASWLERNAGVKPAAVLLLPAHRTDPQGDCREALLSGKLAELICDAALIGMPADCRRSTGGRHLCDWFAALAAVSLLTGRKGVYTWSIPAANMSWAAFGDQEARVRESFTALMRMAALTGMYYAVTIEHALANPNWLRDRVKGWYHTYFQEARRLDEADRKQLADEARSFRLSLLSLAGWMREILDTLPPVLQWSDALHKEAGKAREHYDEVLGTAGRLAWLIDEAEQSGLADEHFVHRYDMSDSEAEAAMKQIDVLRDTLSSQLAEQETHFRIIGGRLTRSVLQQVLREEDGKATELRKQAEEGVRRIARAAEMATQEEMPKVATARARLTRMERQVTLLSGRATRARRDLASWDRDDRRGLMPTLDLSREQTSVILFPEEWMKALQCLQDPEDKASAPMTKLLLEQWPWPEHSARMMCDAVASASPAPAGDALGGFIRALWQSCRA